VIAKAKCRGGGTISHNTPSDGCESEFVLERLEGISLADPDLWQLIIQRLYAGTLSANASTLVRSIGPSVAIAAPPDPSFRLE
jgi:hypothetical protein